MPTDVEPSEAASGIPKPFLYFLAGLAVGAVCVLLPFLCVLPIALHSARSGDQLQAQLAAKDVEIARLLQAQTQTPDRPPPPPSSQYPPPGYPPPPPPRHAPEPRFDGPPDAP